MVEHFDNLLNNLLNSTFSVWNSYKLLSNLANNIRKRRKKNVFFAADEGEKKGRCCF